MCSSALLINFDFLTSLIRFEIKLLLKHEHRSESEDEKIYAAQQCLRNDLDKWRIIQLDFFPKLIEEFESKVTNSIDLATPEDEPLLLPSTFSETYCMALGLGLAGKAEKELRIGWAHDRLENVRTAIQTYNHHVEMKAKEVRSQRHITHARIIVEELMAQVWRPAYHYNKIRKALLSLGLPPDDPALRELKDTELWAKNAAIPAKLGDSRKQDPWFWHVACPAGSSSAEKTTFQCESRFHLSKYDILY